MASKPTERMADVLLTATERPDGKAFSDGRPNYPAARAGLIRRGYLAERGEFDYLTAEGRAVVAERVDRIKAAVRTRGEAAEVAALAHTAELARRLGWRPTPGERVQIIGEAGTATVIHDGPARAHDCRDCGRRCLSVTVTHNGGHIYGTPQCEVTPTADTLAAYLTARADTLAEGIALDPTYPANDRWRVELATFRRLAAEVTEAEPVAELAGTEAAELAEQCDRAAADYMTADPGAGLAGVTVRHLAAALRSVRRGGHPGAHLLALAAARQAAEPVAVNLAERVATWHRHPTGPRAASWVRTPAAEAEPVTEYDGQAEAAESADEWAAYLAELARRAEHGPAAAAALAELAGLAEGDTEAEAVVAELIGRGAITCAWFLRCDRAADHLAAHPVLRVVPACRRCHTAEAEPAGAGQ